MREFFSIMRYYLFPYKWYMIGALFFNILSAVLNVFSFVAIIPMLQLLFGIDQTRYAFIPWDAGGSIKDIAVNNLYWYTTQLMEQHGPSITLFLMRS